MLWKKEYPLGTGALFIKDSNPLIDLLTWLDLWQDPGVSEAGIPPHTMLHHRSLELFNFEACVTGKEVHVQCSPKVSWCLFKQFWSLLEFQSLEVRLCWCLMQFILAEDPSMGWTTRDQCCPENENFLNGPLHSNEDICPFRGVNLLLVSTVSCLWPTSGFLAMGWCLKDHFGDCFVLGRMWRKNLSKKSCKTVHVHHYMYTLLLRSCPRSFNR